MSSTSSSRLCNCLRSMWASTGQFIVSQDESVRRRRRLLFGIVVLLMVDVLWVGSSELTDVRTNLILIITTLLRDSVPPNIKKKPFHQNITIKINKCNYHLIFLVCNHIIWPQGCYVGDQYKIHVFFYTESASERGLKFPVERNASVIDHQKLFTMMSSHVNQLIWLLLSGAVH